MTSIPRIYFLIGFLFLNHSTASACPSEDHISQEELIFKRIQYVYRRVLEKMKVEVDRGNADPSYYAMLVDRVNINTGKPQVYGTQVTYKTDLCQAYPLPLADSANMKGTLKLLICKKLSTLSIL
jgi:hypothetical protein